MHHTSDKIQGQVYIPAANWTCKLPNVIAFLFFSNDSSDDRHYYPRRGVERRDSAVECLWVRTSLATSCVLRQLIIAHVDLPFRQSCSRPPRLFVCKLCTSNSCQPSSLYCSSSGSDSLTVRNIQTRHVMLDLNHVQNI